VRRALLPLAAAVLMGACIDESGARPRSAGRSAQSTGQKLAIRQIANKSQQYGLEDALIAALRDEFLRDGRYQLVPEKEADDVVVITLSHYILAPLAYDVTLAPITYKLRISADVSLVDRATNKELWKEENLEGSLTYPNQTLAGGESEQQAQATIWTVMAPMIVSRVVDGFNVAPSTSSANPNPVVK
jgi:hypothetical protein